MNKSVILDAKNFFLELNAKIYKNDPPINNSLLHIIIRSDDFAGIMDMDVGIKDIEDFVKNIHIMNTKVKGYAKIKEPYGESFINMEIDKTGHVKVCGYMNTFNNKLNFNNEFDLFYLDQFDKALTNEGSWKELI